MVRMRTINTLPGHLEIASSAPVLVFYLYIYYPKQISRY